MRALRVALVAVPLSVLAGLLALPLLVVAGASGTAATDGAAALIPARVLSAYLAAEDACPGLHWQLLAGVGWVESRHGTSGGARADPETGAVTPRIFGPLLDGRAGTEAHPAGRFAGRWGLTGPYERALGPMQFRPPTFAAWGVDADGDGALDPHDVDDAVATAAAYLCGPQGVVEDERAALARYNTGRAYADAVLAYAAGLEAPVLVGALLCPVAGPTSFTDTWGAPRSGGRRHQGVDMFARSGTPVVAPVAGQIEHFDDALGGLSFRLYGDDGNYYFGTHLSAFGPASGHVGVGTVIGFVGASGNAAGTGAHLHFEIHPGRGPGERRAPVNPTPTVAAACAEERVGVGLLGGD